MRKIIMTREIRRAFYQKRKGNTGRNKPKLPYCKICSDLTKQRRRVVNYLHAGDEVYEVHFANGGISYYHVDCMDRNSSIAQTIKSLDVDKWNGLEEFIRTQVDRKLGDKHIIHQIAEQFNSSYTTAWRRLREFKMNLP